MLNILVRVVLKIKIFHDHLTYGTLLYHHVATEYETASKVLWTQDMLGALAEQRHRCTRQDE